MRSEEEESIPTETDEGEGVVVPIAVEGDLEDVPIVNPPAEVPLDIPPVAATANKYSRGELIVVAGSDLYTGAAVLCAKASQRMGAGYTEVITTSAAVPIVRNASASLVVRDREDWNAEELSKRTSHNPWAVAIGPGFTGSDDEAKLVRGVLKQCPRPVLVDGGALGALTSKKALKHLAKRADLGLPTVITPHEGEAVRLAKGLGLAVSEDAKMAGALAYALRSVVVLKGPNTFISDGKATVVMSEGTPALAKAGTGDVLSGMIAALLAQGVEPMQASFTGSTIHARAGRFASHLYAETSVIAEDIIDCIPAIIKQCS